jgi:hypothetical protein
LCAVLLTGCYHQVVSTGLPAGETKVAKPWTATWVFGLVPATPIDVRAQCPNGVAEVDTQMTFLNGLVSGLTLGIFTPRSVTVTCSGAGSASNAAARLDVATTGGGDALQVALESAAAMSAKLGAPVLVDWRAGQSATSLTR